MNSERRHELQQNWLASRLATINQSIDPYSKPIAVAVAIGFIGLLGWGFYSSTQSDRRSDATLQLIEASTSGDSESLATVAAQYPDTPVAPWSRLYQGSQKMAVGLNALFTNRGEAEELLAEATAAYDEALETSNDRVIRSRAYFGKARIDESLGKVDEAIENYEAAMAVGESDAMVEESKRRIETLSQAATKDFLVWFGDQDFSPADPALPPSLPGSGMLPDLPDLDLPDLDFSNSELEGPDSEKPDSQLAEDVKMQEPSTVDSAKTDSNEDAKEKPAGEAVKKPANEAVEEKPATNAPESSGS